jgi:hypothetical protein
MTTPSWPLWVIRIGIFLTALGGLVYSLYLFSARDMSARESALLGIMLTICSTLAGWMVTHIYSAYQISDAVREVQERSQANLRTYALKASEKVNNLSNELNRLAIYLEQDLISDEFADPHEMLHVREERIESAIHIIRTLKSVNDTSLSDWEGVIGDELDQQREERKEKEEELIGLINRTENLIEGQRQELIGSHEEANSLRGEVQQMTRELRAALAELGVSRLPKSPSCLPVAGKRLH